MYNVTLFITGKARFVGGWWWWVVGCSSAGYEKILCKYTPRKLTFWTPKRRFGSRCSFSKGSFSGSMLVFWGADDVTTHLNFRDMKTDISQKRRMLVWWVWWRTRAKKGFTKKTPDHAFPMPSWHQLSTVVYLGSKDSRVDILKDDVLDSLPWGLWNQPRFGWCDSCEFVTSKYSKSFLKHVFFLLSAV